MLSYEFFMNGNAVDEICHAYPEMMAEWAQKVSSITVAKIAKEVLTDDELDRYIKLIPGPDHSSRRMMLIKWLKQYPQFKSRNPNEIYEHYQLWLKEYGKIYRKVHPPKARPMRETIKRYNRMISHERRQMEQSQEQPQEQAQAIETEEEYLA